ncbi:hypothetical protein [Vibrio penaeicida]|uniref:hypothetical protein n=1 Tax=Vibrio penaeicida TaxID=104609 RepID=UPI000CE9E53D|nr:hypothetical protein [Vibrio penaeicida]
MLSQVKKKEENKNLQKQEQEQASKREQELAQQLQDKQAKELQLQEEYEQKYEQQKRGLEVERQKIANEIVIHKEKLEKQTLEKELNKNESDELLKKEEAISQANLVKLNEQKAHAEAKAANSKLKRERVWGWLKLALAIISILSLIVSLLFGLYRLYRWVTEEPLIKTVEKQVEVEKEVIPDECTQIRRNGKVYISCDGVKVEGAPTIGDSGINQVPELITE